MLTNQGDQWLGKDNGGEGRRPSARRGELHREPPAHRPTRRGHLRARAPASPAGRALPAEPLRHGADDRPGRVGHRRDQRAARRLPRAGRPDARPPRTAHHRGHRRRAVRRRARLPRRRRRASSADQAPAHRTGHPGHRAAQPRRARRPCVRRGRRRRPGPVPHARGRGPGDGADGPARGVHRRAGADRRDAQGLPARAEPHHRPRLERARHGRAPRHDRAPLLRPGRLARGAPGGRPDPVPAARLRRGGARRCPRCLPRGRRPHRLGSGAHHRSARFHAGAAVGAPQHRVVRAGAGRLRPGAPPRAGDDHPRVRPGAARRGAGRPRDPPGQPAGASPPHPDRGHAPDRRRLGRGQGRDEAGGLGGPAARNVRWPTSKVQQRTILGGDEAIEQLVLAGQARGGPAATAAYDRA